jgi:hypothetical protein
LNFGFVVSFAIGRVSEVFKSAAERTEESCPRQDGLAAETLSR